jgi:hypothetical protein
VVFSSAALKAGFLGEDCSRKAWDLPANYLDWVWVSSLGERSERKLSTTDADARCTATECRHSSAVPALVRRPVVRRGQGPACKILSSQRNSIRHMAKGPAGSHTDGTAAQAKPSAVLVCMYREFNPSWGRSTAP